MPEFTHPVFGSVGRAERSEASVQRPPQAVQSQQVPEELVEEPLMAVDDLRSLIECGKITDTVEIDGRKFQMSTLADEAQETIFKKFAVVSEDAGSFMELRRTVVAMAVETLNGKPFEYLYPADAPPQPGAFEAKLAIVRKMQGQVVDRLYAFYEELLKRSKQKVEPEQVKN